MMDEGVHFAEGARIEQDIQPFARGFLALVMLPLDAGFAAAPSAVALGGVWRATAQSWAGGSSTVSLSCDDVIAASASLPLM